MRLVLLVLFLCSLLGATEPLDNSEWIWEASYQGLLLVDWRQTSNFHKQVYVDSSGTVHTIRETNMIMGDGKSQARINAGCVVASLSHLLITMVLGPRERRLWQRATVAVEFAAVANNYNIGVRVTF